MVDRAQREAVDDRGDALGLDVGDDVRRLDERPLAQRADRATVPVGAHDVELEALLVQADSGLVRGVSPDVRPGDQAARLHVLDGQPGLEHDGAGRWIVGRDEHRRDDEYCPGASAAEVDEWRPHARRGAQRAVVGLVDRTRAIGVREEGAGLIEGVRVGVLERRHER